MKHMLTKNYESSYFYSYVATNMQHNAIHPQHSILLKITHSERFSVGHHCQLEGRQVRVKHEIHHGQNREEAKK